MKIILLSSTDLVRVLQLKELPIIHQLNKVETYGFVCGSYLYALYRLKHTGKKYHYLIKNSYRPLKVLGLSEVNIAAHPLLSNPEKIQALLKKQNQPCCNLFIKITALKSEYQLHFFSQDFSSLMVHHQVQKEELDSILKSLQVKIQSVNFEQLSFLSTLGSQLFDLLFPKKVRGFLNQVSQYIIYFSYDQEVDTTGVLDEVNSLGHLGIGACYSKEVAKVESTSEFFMLQKTHYHYLQSASLSNKRSSKVKSFQMMTTLEDVTMKVEQEQVKTQFLKKKYFTSKFVVLGSGVSGKVEATRKIDEALTTSDWVHLACHSEKGERNRELALMKGGEVFYTINNFERLSKAPKVLLFSGCHSDDARLVEWFFKAGGQSLLVSEGPLFSEQFSRLIGKFYWRLLFQKVTVAEAYQSLIGDLVYHNDVSAVKFKLYGKGRQRFSSF